MSNPVQDCFGNYYRLITDTSSFSFVTTNAMVFTDIESAKRFLSSLTANDSYWFKLLNDLGLFPILGQPVQEYLATSLFIGSLKAYAVPCFDPNEDKSKRSVKAPSGKTLTLADPQSAEALQSNKVQKITDVREAKKLVEQMDLQNKEIIKVFESTAAAKDPNIPSGDMLQCLSESVACGEVVFVEAMGPKPRSESVEDFVSVFVGGQQDAGLGPEAEECGTCTVASLVVKCAHGRSPGASKVLQIVAEPAKTSKEGYTFLGASLEIERSYGGEETITSDLTLDGKKFASCSLLSVDGCSSNEESNELKLQDNSTRNSERWTGDAKPQSYNIVGSSCTDSDSFTVEMYPNSVYALEVNIEAFHKLCNEANDQLKDWCSGMFGALPFALIPEIKLPTGHCKFSWGWKEESDWRAYYFVKADFGLNPIFGISLKFEVSMLQVAGASVGVPTVVSKFVSEYLADIVVAAYCSYETSLIGSPSYKEYTDGEFTLVGEAIRSSKGVFGLSLTAKVGHESIFSIRASAEAETQVIGEDKLELNREGIFTESGTKVQPLVCRVILIKKYFGMAGKPKSTEWKPWGNKPVDIVPSKREKFFPKD